MVPFAEVMLLTAMEYNREDKKKKKKEKMKGKKKKKVKKAKNLQITPLTGTFVKENMGLNENGRPCFKCGLPSLKTLGEKKQILRIQTLYTRC